MKIFWIEKIRGPKITDRSLWICFFLFLWILNAVGCRLYNLEKKLSPENREFLSKVRYIVTREERKIFLELPDSEKKGFQKEFWNLRDPDPATEENEFKKEYFQRIEEANRLFHGGTPGWLQDRGRIYILIGPPTERLAYPMQAHSKPQEIWYYGNFPVIFVDELGTGDYQLVTLNVAHLLDLNKAQMASQERAKPREDLFDFAVKTRIREENEVIVIVDIDYRDIWFAAIKDRLETTILLSVKLEDHAGTAILSEKKEYPISLHEDDIGKADNIIIDYPLVLKKGTYTLHLELANTAGKESRKKTLKIVL